MPRTLPHPPAHLTAVQGEGGYLDTGAGSLEDGVRIGAVVEAVRRQPRPRAPAPAGGLLLLLVELVPGVQRAGEPLLLLLLLLLHHGAEAEGLVLGLALGSQQPLVTGPLEVIVTGVGDQDVRHGLTVVHRVYLHVDVAG